MSKKNNENQSEAQIESGKPITISAKSRAEAKEKIAALCELAKAQGLKKRTGGFIQFVKKHFLDAGIFQTTITFE